MIVNDEQKYIFIHIPKTAGQSITSRLQDVHPEAFKRHTTALQVSKALPNYDQYFSFTFVRNPWDILYSRYTFLCQKKLKRHLGEDWNQRKFKRKGFKWWLMENEWWPPYDRDGNSPAYQKKPQMDWIVNENGEVIVDFIGRFESLEQDFQQVTQQLGLPCQALPHVHKSKHKPYREAYDQEMIDFVAHYHAADISQFGYEF